jgi:choline dehydrogenase-like flavoprotein
MAETTLGSSKEPVRNLTLFDRHVLTCTSVTFDANFLRSSSYDSYYMRAKDRPNLDVLIRAPALNVNFEGEGADLTAIGVTFMDDSTGLAHNVTATKEVILSAGAFHSPALLMVSVSCISKVHSSVSSAIMICRSDLLSVGHRT